MNNQDQNYRKVIGDEILRYARKDSKIFMLVCDMGFGVMDQFKLEFPERCINVGMMEQGTVGIAAGMALTGMKPIVYSIVNFLAFRSIEQIRNDVVLQNLNVKFIATGVNNYFEQLGISHYCDQDDKKIMNLINMKVYDPYENATTDFPKMVNEWITDSHTGYLRV